MKIPFIQRSAGELAVEELSERLGVPVQIGNINVEWFNHIALENVRLPDQSGQSLIEIKHLSAGFDALPLIKGKLVFSSIRLFGFSFHLRKETKQSPTNLQFVIDAFASKTPKKEKSNIDLRIKSVLLRRGNFSYDIASVDSTPNRFNPSHVNIKNISAAINLKAFNKDSLNGSIKKLNFEESSGFTLNRLSFQITANKDSAELKNFNIRLPESDIKIENAKIDFSNIKSIADLADRAPVSLKIPSSTICLKDLSTFVPAFQNFVEPIDLTAEVSGKINNIDLKKLTLKYSNKMLFIGQMQMKGITHPEEAYIFGEVSKMYITTEGIAGIANNFSDKPILLPDPVKRLGTINFTGEVSGFFDNLVTYGRFSSSIGSLEADLSFGKNKEKNIATFLKGKISTSSLDLARLFAENNPLGRAQLSIDINAARPINGSFSGKANVNIKEFEYKKYRYHDILISGAFRPDAFNGKVEMDDPNGKLQFEGLFSNQGEYSEFNFKSSVRHFRPDSLNLSNKYKDPDVSFDLTADFTGNNIDNLEGSIKLDGLEFLTATDSFYLKKMDIIASGHSNNRLLSISSDIVNGEVKGAYSFETIFPSLIQTMKSYIPALITSTFKKKKIQENNFSLLLTVENTEKLSNTLKLPITILQPSRITGFYNNIYNRFRFEAYLPQFNLGSSMFEGGYLNANNQEEKANVQLKAINYNKKGLRNYIDLEASANNNEIQTQINWANNKERIFKASISANTLFEEINKENGLHSLLTQVKLKESTLILNDSTWTISPSTINIANGIVNINDFSVAKDQEFLTLDGNISKNPADTLYMNMNQVELSYIFDILNIPVLQFGGKATGKFNINDLYGSRMLNTDLQVDDFSFNQVKLGRLNLFSEWDDEQKGIMMLGSIYKNDSTWTDVNGYVYPVGANAGLSLFFDANDLNLAFLHPFVENIAQNMQGRGFGRVHLHGPFSELSVEGDAYVLDGGLGIEFLNTYYNFSDSIHLTKEAIIGRDVKVTDMYGNEATVNLNVAHKHFRDIHFDVDVKTRNLLVYNATKKQNPQIFGTVFGTGTAAIHGTGQLVNIDVNMQNDANSSITLDFMNSSSASDYNFITFVDKKEFAEDIAFATSDSIRKNILAKTNDGTELRMNFLLDITPQAKIEMIMDETAGDKITGNCTGSVQIQYGTKTDLRMYGNVEIVSGNYNFSLQQLIHKDFKIRDGSVISFRGDPLNATMNVNAIYNVTANIQDLDRSFATESARRNIPVNCVLKLDGMLRNPTISFDLELPGSNEELERQVKSLVDTEDMMTRQIVYLLVLNKFYTPDYTMNPYASNDFSAVASSALSSQISSIMNSFTDKVQLGTNIRTSQDGIEDTEVEMLLSSQLLNNRLIFNGNFGYKNNATQKNAFIGEFDLEYLLTPGGDVRLKAYNHANDMYMYLKQALTTQGVGIMYKKDFTRFSDIFRRKKRFLPIRPEIKESLSKDSIESK